MMTADEFLKWMARPDVKAAHEAARYAEAAREQCDDYDGFPDDPIVSPAFARRMRRQRLPKAPVPIPSKK